MATALLSGCVCGATAYCPDSKHDLPGASVLQHLLCLVVCGLCLVVCAWWSVPGGLVVCGWWSVSGGLCLVVCALVPGGLCLLLCAWCRCAAASTECAELVVDCTGNLFQEEQPGGPWAPFTDSAFECTVASSSCHVSATGHACFLVEMTIRRKIEFRQVTQQAGGLSLQVVSTPTLLDLQAEGLLQSADVSKCKKCDQPAVAGNYGFCLEHREFKGSTVAVPAVVGANTLVIKKQKQVDRASASLCTVCAVGGDLSSCDLCPAKFHARCVQRVVGQSLCPAHYCGRVRVALRALLSLKFVCLSLTVCRAHYCGRVLLALLTELSMPFTDFVNHCVCTSLIFWASHCVCASRSCAHSHTL